MIALRQLARVGNIDIPNWAIRLGADSVPPSTMFPSGFVLTVPLMDTTIYLDYLAERFSRAGGKITAGIHVEKLEDVDHAFDLIVNCAGIGARTLANDADLEPHRGQIVLVPKLDGLDCAMVCDDAPLMYVIPRRHDCVFGGTNELRDSLEADPNSTSRILSECARVLGIDQPSLFTERVGLRPFRKSGVRVEGDRMRDGRRVIHNYGHGGSGFTLSWGCAHEVFDLCQIPE